MLAPLSLVALAAVSFVSAANDTICSTSIYPSLACLTSNRGAASVCAGVPRQTLTLTVTTTTLDVNSVTITRNAQSQVTVHSTETETSTKTVTSGPVTTITNTLTRLTTENTTISTYVPTKTAGAGLFPPLCIPSHAVSALGSLGNDTIATACRCIGHIIPTTTITNTVTAKPVKVTSTQVDGTAPTTTVFNIVRSTTTLTVRPAKLTTKHVTSCTTATVVQTYAAPTFTQVYGPKPGCADTAGKTQKLSRGFSNLNRATTECKSICEQDSECEFVYVQRFFSNSADIKPYFGCVLNTKHLDAAKDLECGKKAGVYGVAVGYDALDRGTDPLI